MLNVAASEEPAHHLRWEFSDAVDWEPKLNLKMGSRIANAYLQGKESLAIAIARDGFASMATRAARSSTYPRCGSSSGRTGGSFAASIRTSSSDAQPGRPTSVLTEPARGRSLVYLQRPWVPAPPRRSARRREAPPRRPGSRERDRSRI